MISKEDWHICEGLLSVFMKDGNKQAIGFRTGHYTGSNENSLRDSNLNSQHPSSIQDQLVILDLGSYKETISMETSENKT